MGEKINDIEYKVGQYADDTFLTLDGSNRSLQEAMSLFKQFETCSGLRANMDKTLAVSLGSKVKEKENPCPNLGLKFVSDFTLLGIKFSTRLKDMNALNVESQLKKKKLYLHSTKEEFYL